MYVHLCGLEILCFGIILGGVLPWAIMEHTMLILVALEIGTDVPSDQERSFCLLFVHSSYLSKCLFNVLP